MYMYMYMYISPGLGAELGVRHGRRVLDQRLHPALPRAKHFKML